MEIPKANLPPLLPKEDATKRKELVESILKEFAEDVGESPATEQNFEAVRNRYRLSVSVVFYNVILGTILILIGSIFYGSMPAPSASVTTQDGRIIDISPIRQE